jgi:hypothetical protein
MNPSLRRLALVFVVIIATAIIAIAGCEHIKRAVEPWG